MKKKLSKELLPFNFFEAIDCPYQEIAFDSIKRKFTWLNTSGANDIFEKHQDDFTEKLYELRDSIALNDCWIRDHEIDESTGTWGYSDYEVVDVEKTRKELENELRELFEGVLKEIDIKRQIEIFIEKLKGGESIKYYFNIDMDWYVNKGHYESINNDWIEGVSERLIDGDDGREWISFEWLFDKKENEFVCFKETNLDKRKPYCRWEEEDFETFLRQT